MIYESFRATGAGEAVQGLADLFTLSLHNHDVQDFDVRWEAKCLQTPVQVQTVVALSDQEVARNSGTPNYQQLKAAVKNFILIR